ncbi:glycosyltransferase family 4 protein [Patescibacteria group bacterium]|nr:glycosyltransferase family 4 protein [Patescibacteria group bacterium]
MNKKRILIFSLVYPPFVGGAEIAIKEITDRIDDIEFDMVILRFDSKLPKFERVGNINIYRIGFTSNNPTMSDLVKLPLKLNKLLFPFISCIKASSLHRKYKYDGIWAMMAAFAGFGALFFKLSHPKVPYLLTLQEGDPIDYIKKKVRFVYPLFKRIFTKADFIQTISYYLADWAKDMGFQGKIEVIPNAVNTKHFMQEFPENELNDLKEILGKKDNDKYLITTSRLVLKNACDDVIKALKYLPENIKFVILGDGPDKEMLLELSKKEQVEDRVKFLGLIDHREMPKYLKVSDIFIRPSLSEGLGNSFIEAMAGDLPVIATQEGGIADFLFDKKRNPDKKTTGWAVDVRSSKQIAEAVKDILNNPENTNIVKENAKKMVIEKYDWNIIANDMQEKVFNNLLGNPVSK